jgi:predicted enzyme related to lactoylglutathione lyase
MHQKGEIMFIKSVSIPVADQDRALKFYTEKLGFTLKVDAPCPGMDQRWIELVKPGTEIELVLFTSPGFEAMIGKGMNLMYSTNDVQKTYDTLKAKGVEFLAPPQKEFWGVFAMMKDSEGNVFCIGQETEK